MGKMQRWALTGGIASGKSSVARLLAARGVPVIDADALYHALLAPAGGQPSPLARRVGERFAGVLQGDGTLERRLLGQRIFADPAERQALEAIVHPAIAEAAAAAFDRLQAAGHPLAVYDIPLLFERGLAARYDGVLVVWVPQAVQRERLMRRDGFDAAAADRRLAAQWPLDEKRDRADVVFDNAGSPEALAQAVAAWLDSVARTLA
jgi:dephospho-CoA kinase